MNVTTDGRDDAKKKPKKTPKKPQKTPKKPKKPKKKTQKYPRVLEPKAEGGSAPGPPQRDKQPRRFNLGTNLQERDENSR